MADTTNDGGSAFPVVGVPNVCDEPGMSLRDWFAGQAVAGFLAGKGSDYASDEDGAFIAGYAHDVAEAMMAERERRYPKRKPEPETEAEGVTF